VKCLLFPVLLALGCTVDPTASASAPIIAGTSDKTDTSVVGLFVFSSGPKGDSVCSATVVAPHVVLTAGHCLSPDLAGPIDHVQVFLGDNVNAPNQIADPANLVDVVETDVHPDFDPSTGANDIAVAVTADALPVAPMPMSHDSLGDGDVGTPVHAVGFGESQDGIDASAGPRRSIDTTIFGVTSQQLLLDDVICFGDSGGPTFVDKDGVPTIAGVHSGVTTQSCIGIGADTRVDLYASSFVDPVIDRVDPGFLPPSGCNGSGGAGDPWLIALVVASALAGRRAPS
jgi:secreted trypsin-like serine protease